jgi:hypothetical protein
LNATILPVPVQKVAVQLDEVDGLVAGAVVQENDKSSQMNGHLLAVGAQQRDEATLDPRVLLEITVSDPPQAPPEARRPTTVRPADVQRVESHDGGGHIRRPLLAPGHMHRQEGIDDATGLNDLARATPHRPSQDRQGGSITRSIGRGGARSDVGNEPLDVDAVRMVTHIASSFVASCEPNELGFTTRANLERNQGRTSAAERIPVTEVARADAEPSKASWADRRNSCSHRAFA